MSYLLTFAPWIVYALVPSSHWQWGALAALVITAAQLALYLVRRRPLESLIIELGSTVFFAVATIVAFGNPDSALHHYTPAASAGWLALIAWFSLAVRRPFTLGIAKLTTPREIWPMPGFRRTNVIITTVWALAFTIGCLALATVEATDAAAGIGTAIQIASFVIPVVFTIRYVAAVRARFAR